MPQADDHQPRIPGCVHDVLRLHISPQFYFGEIGGGLGFTLVSVDVQEYFRQVSASAGARGRMRA